MRMVESTVNVPTTPTLYFRTKEWIFLGLFVAFLKLVIEIIIVVRMSSKMISASADELINPKSQLSRG